jgi:hypothetical protein
VANLKLHLIFQVSEEGERMGAGMNFFVMGSLLKCFGN